ncbi:hypothetical protein [Methanobrevibacter sp.]|uniref:hypothetical protein n=1 Tax=Methanobrevibacter sp. TaxID=66852 RepID=UPI0025E066CD|nr:hypothetical protein [Methanobrevibacter sp.]MBQ2666862.1 hypothetical protein [Methanobrevibacter sp.]
MFSKRIIRVLIVVSIIALTCSVIYAAESTEPAHNSSSDADGSVHHSSASVNNKIGPGSSLGFHHDYDFGPFTVTI